MQESLQKESKTVSEIFPARKNNVMNKNKPRQEKKVVQKLFAKLQTNYGGLFTSRFATKAMLEFGIDEWRVELAPYSEQVIFSAYSICKNQYMRGPSMSEFGGICKMIKRSKEQPEKRPPWQQTNYGKEMAKKMCNLVRGR